MGVRPLSSGSEGPMPHPPGSRPRLALRGKGSAPAVGPWLWARPCSPRWRKRVGDGDSD